MEPVTIALNPLDGVAEGVPEIQMRAHPTLALIGCHDGCLDRAAALDRKRQRRRIPALQWFGVIDEPGEKFGIADKTILNDLSQPCRIFSGGQGGERVEIDDHPLRLMKGADEIFTHRVIHARLPTHGRIHLGQ